MLATVPSPLSITVHPRPRRALTAARHGAWGPGGAAAGEPDARRAPDSAPDESAAPAASIAVTVRIDLPGGSIPPEVAGFIESLRGLAGSAAVTLAPTGARNEARTGAPNQARTGAVNEAPAGASIAAASGAAPAAVALLSTGAPSVATAPGGPADAADPANPIGAVATAGAVGASATGSAVAPGPSLHVHLDSRMVLRAGAPIRLTRREYDLLAFLCRHPRRVFSRSQLLSQVWGYELVSGQRTVDVHVRRLRMKLGEPGPVISTVRGVGYRLDDAGQVAVLDGAPART
ncbi:winged helix-turn-helix domain-containing protein [Rugosimonospora acidiphila]|uniref:winged helix-turn-helix domain-containing protein n=1 Tax=Rugosimonospora acidiphila TaxID=556531 RepID=UPI003CD0A403